jgi:hypothetical protein
VRIHKPLQRRARIVKRAATLEFQPQAAHCVPRANSLRQRQAKRVASRVFLDGMPAKAPAHAQPVFKACSQLGPPLNAACALQGLTPPRQDL